jgi:hypothetical protein
VPESRRFYTIDDALQKEPTKWYRECVEELGTIGDASAIRNV